MLKNIERFTLEAFVARHRRFNTAAKSSLVSGSIDPKRATLLISRSTDTDVVINVYNDLVKTHHPDLFVFTSMLAAFFRFNQTKLSTFIVDELIKYSVTPNLYCIQAICGSCEQSSDFKNVYKFFYSIRDVLKTSVRTHSSLF